MKKLLEIIVCDICKTEYRPMDDEVFKELEIPALNEHSKKEYKEVCESCIDSIHEFINNDLPLIN